MALILLVPGGASAALADSEGEASRTGAPVNRQGPLDGGAGASRVAQRRRLVEEAWLSARYRSAAAARARARGAAPRPARARRPRPRPPAWPNRTCTMLRAVVDEKGFAPPHEIHLRR